MFDLEHQSGMKLSIHSNHASFLSIITHVQQQQALEYVSALRSQRTRITAIRTTTTTTKQRSTMIPSLFPSPSITRRKTLGKTSWNLSTRSLPSMPLPGPFFRRKNSQPEDDHVRTSRRVRFNDEQLCTLIEEDQEEWTEEEIQGSWFHHADFSRFEKDRMLTSLEFMASRRIGGNRFDNDNYTARGLEMITNDPSLKRRQHNDKQDLMKGILAESARQKKLEDGVPNFDRYAAISQRHTRCSRDRALFLGQSDERACRPKESFGAVGVTGSQLVTAISRQACKASQTLRRRGSGVVLRTDVPLEGQRSLVV